ncbi:hypothetical protein BKA66DRAFT_446239 [Pyrenochaeta sp. MPI-SDFR-AT-0127]|nr:hypothetical protein BKA66DRAFT_446239 [Pyrenochaeta sp. MPI-SDFR-AT-0127]
MGTWGSCLLVIASLSYHALKYLPAGIRAPWKAPRAALDPRRCVYGGKRPSCASNLTVWYLQPKAATIEREYAMTVTDDLISQPRATICTRVLCVPVMGLHRFSTTTSLKSVRSFEPIVAQR